MTRPMLAVQSLSPEVDKAMNRFHPSCAAKRAAATEEHLIDNLLPRAPYRQFTGSSLRRKMVQRLFTDGSCFLPSNALVIQW